MQDDVVPRLIMMALFISALVMLWIWWMFLGRKRLIQDVPTSAARGVALGLNELIGTAECVSTEPSPQAGIECVWWKNTFYKSDNDDGWRKTKERVGGPGAFEVADESGSVPVRPRRAQVTAPKVYDGPYVDPVLRDPDTTLVTRYLSQRADGSTKRKVIEHALSVGEPVYVLGTAQLPHESLDVYIGPDPEGDDPFLVRAGSEDDALFAERVGTAVGFLGCLLASAGAGIAWADGVALHDGTLTWAEVDPATPIVFAAIALAAMFAISLVFVYNGLVRLRHRAQAAWGLIDVQLRRRHDLLPNLARVVEAHTTHESDVQRSLVELRSRLAEDLPATPSDEAVRSADNAIRAETAALDRLLALAEAYPVLTAEQTFASLRDALIDTENRVALAREFYNNSVLALHDRARAVPGSLVAWLFEIDLEAEFVGDLGGTEVPSVETSGVSVR